MIQKKLTEHRKAKGFTQVQMAKLIALDQTTYSKKENGKSPISDDEWSRFAKTLQVEVDEIKEENESTMKNENCTFNDTSIGINYINIPQNLLDIVVKYNHKLEEENKNLKEQLAVFAK